METLSLCIPARTGKLSDIENDPRKIRAWLSELKLDHQDTARKVLQVLYAQNRIQLPPRQRMENADAMAEILEGSGDVLLKQLGEVSVPLEKEQTETIRLLQKIQRELSYSYKSALIDLLKGRKLLGNDKLALVAAIKSVRHLTSLLLTYQHAYIPQPTRVWKDLNAIFRYARSQQSSKSLNLKAVLEQHYQTAVLLTLANPYGLAPGQSLKLHAFLAQWPASVSRLQWDSRSDGKVSNFIVSLIADSPPMPFKSTEKTAASSNLLTFNAAPMLEQLHVLIQQLEAGEDPALTKMLGETTEERLFLLRRLGKYWGATPLRRFQRLETSGSIYLCRGISTLYTLLMRGKTDTVIDELDEVPMCRWQLLNESPGSIGIVHGKDLPRHFKPGDFVGVLSPESGKWRAAVVRWTRIDRRYEMGLEILGPEVKPTMVTVDEDNEQRHPALLIPGSGVLHTTDSILLDNDTCDGKQFCNLLLSGRIQPLDLVQAVETSQSFRHIRLS